MVERREVSFDSGGLRCAAWLYEPEGATACVILAHGWTGVREQRLDAFAERFAEAGFAALVFDYRHFGASEGEPRSLISVTRQQADWRAAIAYARTLSGIGWDRVALWGTSFSGGHVLAVGAGDPRIAAIIALVPFVDGFGNLLRLGKPHAARLTIEGLRDQAGALAGRPPHMLASVGPPGSLAVMNSPDAEPGFLALNPPGLPWPNEGSARIALTVGLYRPTSKVADIRCPILFGIGENDVITPPDLAAKAAARASLGEVRHYPGGHFDQYVGEGFEQAVSDQTDFLLRHLSGAARSPLSRQPAAVAESSPGAPVPG